MGQIVRRYGAAFLRAYPGTPPGVVRTLRAVAACRTAALGGHVTCCTHCQAVRYHYHSCGDRHCPQCGGSKRAAWLEQRQTELLPVPYFHVVFTLPHTLSALVLGNRKQLYGLLFEAAAQTLLEVAADPQHLGARVGVLAVLHTWGQQLEHHPHVHGVVPGGGLSATGDGWVPCRPNFFLPVKVLGRVFRGKYLAGLRDAYARGALHFGGSTATLAEASVFAGLVKELYRTEWVVYAKEPFGGPEQVLKYLTGYTHRVALSNRRLVRLEKDQVTLTWKDYAAGCAPKELTLAAVEFVRRFALHILPKGLVRIRQYGLLANRGRRERLARCRALLGVAAVTGRESVTPESPAAGRGGRLWLGPYLLVVLLSGILGPAERAALTTALVASVATWGTCPDCGVGRPETIWRRERPTGRELTEQWEWDTS